MDVKSLSLRLGSLSPLLEASAWFQNYAAIEFKENTFFMIKVTTDAVIAFFRQLKQFQIGQQLQSFVAIAFVGLFLLTTSVDNSSLNSSTKAMLNDMIARGEADGRPVTTAQWRGENRELKGNPGERIERIAEETGDAIENMAEIYPGNAKSVLPGMSNDSLERDD